jgi:hypothetical protein
MATLRGSVYGKPALERGGLAFCRLAVTNEPAFYRFMRKGPNAIAIH